MATVEGCALLSSPSAVFLHQLSETRMRLFSEETLGKSQRKSCARILFRRSRRDTRSKMPAKCSPTPPP